MQDAVKVLWLIKGLGPGGAEQLLVTAARIVDRDRFDVEVAYVIPEKSQLVAKLADQNVPSTCLGESAVPWPWRLRRLLRDGRYDVVHLHSPLVAGVARLVIRTLPRHRRPRVVSTEHNAWSSYALSTRVLNALLFRSDERHWAVSHRVRDSIWPWCRRSVEVLEHGILQDNVADPNERSAVRAELGLLDGDVAAITVANFRAEKAYPDLLRAARLAFDEEERLCLLVVGQGPLEQEVRQLHADLRLGERCQILGYRSDVMRLLTGADFFLLASHFEGYPIALMEAMASGLPAVVTDVGGAGEAVTASVDGEIVEPGDWQGLSHAMCTMVDDQHRALLADRALVRGRQFDMRRAVTSMEEVYQGPAMH